MSDTTNSLGDLFARARIELSETARATLLCLACSNLTPANHGDDVVGQMLRGCPPRCSACGAAIDVWKLLRFAMTTGSNAIAFGVPIGLQFTIVWYRLPVNGVKELDLRREGVPANAQLLRVVHRPPRFQTALILDLEALDSARGPLFEYRLLGLWDGHEPAEVDVQGETAVLWAPHDNDDVGRLNLVNALDAFANQRVRDAIIPANVAVERTLGRVVDDYLEWVGVSKKRRQSFLRDAATFSHQLNVLSPVIAAHLAVAPLSDEFRRHLNRLRELRNGSAHGGIPLDATHEEVADCMAAAVVGFGYARMLGEKLAEVRAAG